MGDQCSWVCKSHGLWWCRKSKTSMWKQIENANVNINRKSKTHIWTQIENAHVNTNRKRTCERMKGWKIAASYIWEIFSHFWKTIFQNFVTISINRWNVFWQPIGKKRKHFSFFLIFLHIFFLFLFGFIDIFQSLLFFLPFPFFLFFLFFKFSFNFFLFSLCFSNQSFFLKSQGSCCI